MSGNAQNLKEALVPFANAGLSMLPILSLSANAAVGEPELEVGFDNTAGITVRDYFQSYVPPESGIVHSVRHINVKATITVIKSLITHPDSERLRRAANQYRLAVDFWRLGRESLILAHLWMASEALTKAKIREECSSRGLQNKNNLAESLGIELKELESTIRKEFLLKGDEECYAKARKASDGFEHGYLGFDKIRELSMDVRRRMASYVRSSILELCTIDIASMKILKSPPFDKPLGYWPIVKYIRGKLIGESSDLAAPGNMYPFIRWKPVVKSAVFDKEGKLKIKFKEHFREELGDGITFQPDSIEAWMPD